MVKKKYRIDYRDHSRLTPKIVKNEIYDQKHRNYALNFGSTFRMLKESFNGDDREKKTPAKTKNPKIKKSKDYKRNKKLLSKINQLITNPNFPIGEQARLVEIRKKIELQLREKRYNQKALEKLIYSVLNPQIPFNV